MMPAPKAGLKACATLLLLSLAMAGCGAIGDPLPPLLDIPQAPAELAAVQRGDRVLVSWPPTALTTEGVAPRPDRLGSVKIYRAVLPTLTDKPDLASAKEIATRAAGSTTFEDPITPDWINHTVVYAVKLTNKRGEAAGFSKATAVPVLTVLPPPPAIRYEMTQNAIKLSWPAPGGARYHVFRDGAQIGEVEGGGYDDTNFEFDHPYKYFVRSVTRSGNFAAEGDDSKTIDVTPRDTFPPSIPQGVRVVIAEGAAEITWSPNTEPDLAGYNIYRNGKKLNDALLLNTVYRDTTPGTSPRYSLSAVDTHHNESNRTLEVTP